MRNSKVCMKIYVEVLYSSYIHIHSLVLLYFRVSRCARSPTLVFEMFAFDVLPLLFLCTIFPLSFKTVSVALFHFSLALNLQFSPKACRPRCYLPPAIRTGSHNDVIFVSSRIFSAICHYFSRLYFFISHLNYPPHHCDSTVLFL